MKTYKGEFSPKNPQKYIGTHPIVYRSSWEFAVMRWCDMNTGILKWGSESVIVPYICETDGRVHRYYIDFIIEFATGKKYLIEIKPLSQTAPPNKNKSGKTTPRYIRESLTYVKNISKWKAAKVLAEKNGMIFQVWDEKTLEKLGIYKP